MKKKPICAGCGQLVKPGEGYFDIRYRIYLHFEKVDLDDPREERNLGIGMDGTVAIGGQPDVASGACSMAYVINTRRPYDFDPRHIIPVTNLNDIKGE